MSRVTFREIGQTDQHPIPYLLDATEPFQPKPHVSTWWITLNSNKSVSGATRGDDIRSQLMRLLRDCFGNNDNLVRFLNFNYRYVSEAYVLTPNMLLDNKLFPDIPGRTGSNQRLKYVFETGSKMKRLHLHAEFRIIHYTNLRMDYAKLDGLIAELLLAHAHSGTGLKKVYVHLEFVPSSLPLYNYMRKTSKLKKAASSRFTLERVREWQSGHNTDYEEAVRELANISLD